MEEFDLVYKKEKSENKYWRHRLGFANIGVAGNSFDRVWSFGLGYAFGIENRKIINDKMKFIHGFEPSASLTYSSIGNQTGGWAYTIGLGYVLGFQYDFSESFYINIETVPGLQLSGTHIDDFNSGYAVNAGITFNAVALTLACKF